MNKYSICGLIVVVLFLYISFCIGIANFVDPYINALQGILFVNLIFLVFGFFTFLYFLPTYISIKKQSKYSLQISILNTFLGFSLIGWVAALIWATFDNKADKVETKTPLILAISVYILALLGWFLYLHNYNSIDNQIDRMNDKFEQQEQETINAIKTLQKHYSNNY